MNVADVMTRGVISISSDTSMREAALLLLRYELSGFPVVDNGKLVGVVTEGDFLRPPAGAQQTSPRWIEELAERRADGHPPAQNRKIGDVMTRNVVTIDPTAPVSEAVRLMEQHHVKRLPVVQNGAVVGIISRANLLHAFIIACAADANSVPSGATACEELAATLAPRP